MSQAGMNENERNSFPLEFNPLNLDVDEELHSSDEDVPRPKSKKRARPRKTRKTEHTARASIWEHFHRYMCDVDKIQKGRCKYCSEIIRADPENGTKALHNHKNKCKKKPGDGDDAKVQTKIAFQQTRLGDGEASMVAWKFDQAKAREALAFWLIVDELAFKTIENPGFKFLISVICPMFKLPSRRTITRDICTMYDVERDKLKKFITDHSQRISLTTDTWTSLQRVNYMCLTCHFIDDEWNLHKKILNFCPISGHKSEEVGKGVEQCLIDWGFEKIFTVTVDNASSNDGAITYLQKIFDHWGTNILGGKYVHMRCIAHIVNLIVQDGLKNKEEHVAISRIRGAVRYIRNSPARLKKFKECVARRKLDTQKLLCLDVPTRWNSTFLILEAAISLRLAFDAYADVDGGYANDLSKPSHDGVPTGVPTNDDWERAKLLMKFLGHFYKLTLCISGSKYVTSNLVFHQITGVDMLLRQWLDSEDFELSKMAKRMKDKFDKYWGAIDKMNLILYYGVVFDPRRKMKFLNFSLDALYKDIGQNMMMKASVNSGLTELFEAYKSTYSDQSSQTSFPTSSTSANTSRESMGGLEFDDTSMFLIHQFKKHIGGERTENVKSELEKYLAEDIEDDSERFDVLKWWKMNSIRFPILGRMARDILAVPVSTVASESTFSTGGRVLDPFRSSLSPSIVQSLICCQDWLRMDSTPITVEENLSDIESLDQELKELGIGSKVIDI